MILLLLGWVLAAVAPVVIPALLLLRERTRRSGVIFLTLYTITYVGLSACGGYAARDLGGGWSNQPRYIAFHWWCPLGCGNAVGTDPSTGRPIRELNAVGAFFWPLLLMDRAILHPHLEPS